MRVVGNKKARTRMLAVRALHVPCANGTAISNAPFAVACTGARVVGAQVRAGGTCQYARGVREARATTPWFRSMKAVVSSCTRCSSFVQCVS